MTALAQVRRFAWRLDAATPPHRDRAVDALRALAIAGVIGGHWLVTALVLGKNDVLSDNSPLASMPWLAPPIQPTRGRSRGSRGSVQAQPGMQLGSTTT